MLTNRSMLNLKQLSDNDLFEESSEFLLVAVVYGGGGGGDLQRGLASKLRKKRRSRKSKILVLHTLEELTHTLSLARLSSPFSKRPRGTRESGQRD